MSTSDTVWIAVATHLNPEGQAVQNLKRQGYECYCPCTCVQRRHARRSETVKRPFFPGYLVVRLDRSRDQWRPIMHSRGVRTVVRFGEKLGIVPQGVIECLLARCSEDGWFGPRTWRSLERSRPDEAGCKSIRLLSVVPSQSGATERR